MKKKSIHAKRKKSKKMVRILSKRTIEEKMTYFVYFLFKKQKSGVQMETNVLKYKIE
ncbi:hypothetical protein C823_006565 [Eubacterium plexicaudatum ASF492]|nr:hypothetical protein C823_006565 [Eubacterium plexicaudatum ASF492]